MSMLPEGQVGYFSHYFREWCTKSGALRSYFEYIDNPSECAIKIFNLSEKTLRTKVKTFRERIGETYPDEVDSTMYEFCDEILKLDTLALEYNSKFVDFEGEPDKDGILKMIERAEDIRAETYKLRGL